MPSVTEICSLALLKLGDQPITDLNEDSTRALIIRTLYPEVRDSVIRAHTWNATTKRVALALLASTPVWEYDSKFQLPADCLRVFETDLPKSETWKVEARTILCNSTSLSIRYAARIEDPTQWDSLLVSAVIAKLAAEAAVPITANTALARDMWALYNGKMAEAMGMDGQEGTPPTLTADDLIDVRN